MIIRLFKKESKDAVQQNNDIDIEEKPSTHIATIIQDSLKEIEQLTKFGGKVLAFKRLI